MDLRTEAEVAMATAQERPPKPPKSVADSLRKVAVAMVQSAHICPPGP